MKLDRTLIDKDGAPTVKETQSSLDVKQWGCPVQNCEYTNAPEVLRQGRGFEGVYEAKRNRKQEGVYPRSILLS